MGMGPIDAKAETDRFSTCDEVKAALSFMPHLIVEGANDRLWEVASDLGGFVHIDIEEDEGLTLFEKSDTTVN